jgi:hypothetical protein
MTYKTALQMNEGTPSGSEYNKPIGWSAEGPHRGTLPLPFNETKHSTQSEHHVEFLNIKPGGMYRYR